jgi:hypothetical protein
MALPTINSKARDDRYFRWLHFGNLLATKGEPDGPRTAKWKALVEDLKAIHDDCGPWDAIFITGDIAFRAAYERATERLVWLSEELRAIGSTPVVLTVPGMVDQQLFLSSKGLSVVRTLQNWVWEPKKGRTPDGIKELFADYQAWSATLARPPAYAEGLLPGDFAATIELGSRRIGIAGMNMALSDAWDDDVDVFAVALSPYQLEAACGGNPDGWAGEHDVCLLLTAYAPQHLDPEVAPAFYTEIAPPGRFALQLCGAWRSADKFTCMQDGPTFVVQGPPLFKYGRRRVAPGYVPGTLALEPGPEPLILRPRRYEAARKTYIDHPDFSPEPVETFRRSVARTQTPPRDAPGPAPGPSAKAHLSSRRRLARADPAAGHLRVRYLEVEQFRCLDLLRIDFAQPGSLPGQWTCLAGINGAGKSSILQALAVGLLGEPLCRELGGDRLLRMQRLVNDRRNESRVRLWLEEGRKRHYVEVTLGGDDYETRWGKPGPPKALTAFWKAMRNRVLVAYGSARNLSDFIDSRHSSLSPDVRRIMTVFDPLSQVTSAEYLLNKRAIENSPLPELFRALVKQVFDKELGVHVRGGKLKFSVGGEPVEAVDLPDGFRSSIAWLVDLCDVWCQKTGPHAKPPKPADIEAIVLIDEIDLHLHPSLQRTLVPRLRKTLPKVQWIVSTHSPLILSSFESAELIALDRQVPGGIRVLDREILGFTTDQVYNWLMGTPATSAALEESLAGASSVAEQEGLAKVLQMSPEVDAEEAARLASLRKERLQRLKP